MRPAGHADGTPSHGFARRRGRARRAKGSRRALRGGVDPVASASIAFVVVAVAIGYGVIHRGSATGDYRQAMASGRYDLAARWVRPESDAGNPEAQTALGNLHYLGLGVPQDARAAAERYFAAASGGFAPAQVNLGHLYDQGLGVPQDGLRAFGWYHHADVAGSPVAEYYLSRIGAEWTLSPLQRATAVKTWRRLDDLVAEGL